MKLIEVNPSKLFNRADRACAKLARIARGDTVYGGVKALVLAKRLNRMGTKLPVDAIVGDVYAASNYSLGDWGAYECPECGCAHLGRDAALQCCSADLEDSED